MSNFQSTLAKIVTAALTVAVGRNQRIPKSTLNEWKLPSANSSEALKNTDESKRDYMLSKRGENSSCKSC